MTENERGRAPGYRAYVVLKNGEKSYWREIGAAWKHNDGDGFSVKLDCLPIGGADIVLRAVNASTGLEANGDEAGRPEKNASKKRSSTPAP